MITKTIRSIMNTINNHFNTIFKPNAKIADFLLNIVVESVLIVVLFILVCHVLLQLNSRFYSIYCHG